MLGNAVGGQFELPRAAVSELEAQSGGFAVDAHGEGSIVGLQEELCAEPAHVMVHDSRDNEIALGPQVGAGYRLGRLDQTGHRALHIGQGKPIEKPVLLERVVGIARPLAGRRAGVEVAVEQQIGAVAAAAHNADDVGPTRHHVLQMHLIEHAGLAHLRREVVGNRAFLGDFTGNPRQAGGEFHQSIRVNVGKEFVCADRHRLHSLLQRHARLGRSEPSILHIVLDCPDWSVANVEQGPHAFSRQLCIMGADRKGR